MAVPRKLVMVPNAATRELWRIAESGHVDELESVLPQAEINARNEHGVTALMRAAYHGRGEMVRVLLEHGADPNLTRNDNFTALSLAAFFGHVEIVEVLMRHGANSDVATRFGTSPHMWATARSYGDVARSLEKRRKETNEPALERPAPPARDPVPIPERIVPEPRELPEYEDTEPRPAVIRTLSEPPEIWDLVHEAPRNFNARSAFVARTGRKGAWALAAVLLIVIGVGGGAAFYMKEKIPSLPTISTSTAATTKPATKTTAPATATAPAQATAPVQATASSQANGSTSTTPHPETALPALSVASSTATTQPIDTATVVPEQSITPTYPATTGANSFARRWRSPARSRVPSNDLGTAPDSAQTAPEVPVVTTPKPAVQASNDAETKKPAAAVSSPPAAQPKPTQQPSKAKVIQWP